MNEVSIIGGADGPTAILLTGIPSSGSAAVLLAVLAVLAVSAAAMLAAGWLYHRR